MSKVFRVSFEVKKGGSRDYAIDISAKSQKEATAKVKEMWAESHTEHAFGIRAKQLQEDAVYKDFEIIG